MLKIMFVCHGNICRSPMAEFVMRDLCAKLGLSSEISCASSATSQEEIGNPVYPPARRILATLGIDTKGKTARQITRQDLKDYDYVILMEGYNLTNLSRLYPDYPQDKVHLLLDFTDTPGDIDDPWYTGDFKTALAQIQTGCKGLLLHLKKRGVADFDDWALSAL